ncbi:hypothetical protein I547_6078 [Mycobacterium kansasii 824]|nr:hypothetical protein I547_6078 [Mycobacterium kansasii 824]
MQGARLDSVGRPVAGVDVRIVSPETGQVLGPGKSAKSRPARHL